MSSIRFFSAPRLPWFAGLPILETSWLAKLIGLLIYIGAGMLATRFRPTPEMRLTGAMVAIASFARIVGTAVRKLPLGWLQPPVVR